MKPVPWCSLISVVILIHVSTLSFGADEVVPDADDAAESIAQVDAAVGEDHNPVLAWDRADRYVAPDFETYFPDDVEAGKQLDELLAGKRKIESEAERLALIRRGLRRTSRYRTTLLGSVGNQFIWNRNPQDRLAIELMYHASACPDSDVAHYALYHGPTVVSKRTPNLIRMLMERYPSLDRQMQNRIAWGMRTYGDKEQTRQLLLNLLDRHAELSASTVGATLNTYESVFGSAPPEMRRFDELGRWVIGFHRADVSAHHPRAADILREMIDAALTDQPDRLLEFVTRVDAEHEVGVVVVKGVRARNVLIESLARSTNVEIDFREMLTPRTLQERRLREFADFLPDGLPKHAKPQYTRPPLEQTYAFDAAEFVPPDFESYFSGDKESGEKLDQLYASANTVDVSDRELLDLFRRGVRYSSHRPNVLFGWISSSLGWPRDPMLTEILYQACDPNAPAEIRKAAIYYGFGLGTEKTNNILQAMFRVYMAPPYDRTNNGNLRTRILWGVRDNEDDKHFLASRFQESLANHETIADQALFQADRAYRQLTGEAPPNANAYASRGKFLVMFHDGQSKSLQESNQYITDWLAKSEHVIDLECTQRDGNSMAMIVARGSGGVRWLTQEIQSRPRMRIYFADLLTKELIDQAEDDLLRKFEKHLPDSAE